MRSICKTASTIGVLTLMLGSAANAADMRPLPPPGPLLQNPPLLVDEFSSGWYLRGDIGYRWNKVDDVVSVGATPVVLNDTLGKSWVIGGGVGYKWEWFRSDLTLDYGTRAKFTADSPLQSHDFTAKIDNFTGLVNVYGDLGTWWGLTPYIGAGAGVAHLQASQFNVASSGSAEAGSNAKWNFAWAYMAGISYKLFNNYNIDVGYRHINMGDTNTGVDAFGNQLTFKKVSADEVRVGFRYTLD